MFFKLLFFPFPLLDHFVPIKVNQKTKECFTDVKGSPGSWPVELESGLVVWKERSLTFYTVASREQHVIYKVLCSCSMVRLRFQTFSGVQRSRWTCDGLCSCWMNPWEARGMGKKGKRKSTLTPSVGKTEHTHFFVERFWRGSWESTKVTQYRVTEIKWAGAVSPAKSSKRSQRSPSLLAEKQEEPVGLHSYVN